MRAWDDQWTASPIFNSTPYSRAQAVRLFTSTPVREQLRRQVTPVTLRWLHELCHHPQQRDPFGSLLPIRLAVVLGPYHNMTTSPPQPPIRLPHVARACVNAGTECHLAFVLCQSNASCLPFSWDPDNLSEPQDVVEFRHLECVTSLCMISRSSQSRQKPLWLGGLPSMRLPDGTMPARVDGCERFPREELSSVCTAGPVYVLGGPREGDGRPNQVLETL